LPDCQWDASSDDSWIHIAAAPKSVSGDGGVGYSVDANGGAQRVGHLTIAGMSFAVTEAGSGGGGGPTFHPLSKCTLLDTRKPNGPFGGPPLGANAGRTVKVNGRCAIPSGVDGLRADVTVLNAKQRGNLKLSAAGSQLPAIQKSFGKGNKKFSGLQVPVKGNTFTAKSNKGIGLLVEVTGYFD